MVKKYKLINDDNQIDLTGGWFPLMPSVSLAVPATVSMPTTFSAGVPLIDSPRGFQGVLLGPKINLVPKNNSNANLKIQAPGMDINIRGNQYQLLKLIADTEAIIHNRKSKVDTNSQWTELDDDALNSEKLISNTQSNSTNGWSMITLSNGKRGLQYQNNGTSTYYSGSGIMLFEQSYNNGSGKNQPAVILFRRAIGNSQMYEELGGEVDNSDFSGEATLEVAAKREAKEESCGLFKFDSITLKRPVSGINMYTDASYNGANYRCFAVGIGSIPRLESYYRMNRNQLTSNNAPRHWTETDDVQRFYLSDLATSIAANNGGDLLCSDANGVNRTIRGRAKVVLKDMLNGYSTGNNCIAKMAINYPNTTNVTINNNVPSTQFLNGTNVVLFM
jgi:hypothetical protein